MAKYIQNNIQFTNVPISKKQMNMKRLFTMIVALAAIIAYASAQTLSVQPIEVQTGEQTEMVVNLTGGTSATALQFNLKLPEGVTAETSSITLGSATDGHTLSVQTLNSGDLLFILYSMDLKPFKDGELIRIPVTAGSTETTSNGKLYTVRTATADAVSHTCEDATFSAIVSGAYKLGDANGDGRISVTDVGIVISYILQKNPAGFNEDAADVNGDGRISITDVGAIITKILKGEVPQETVYYWYVGVVPPTDPTSTSENTGLNKWTSLGTSLPTSSIQVVKEDPEYNDHTWYIAAPADANFTLYNATNVASNEAGWNKSTITIGNVSYTLWTCKMQGDQAVGYLHK